MDRFLQRKTFSKAMAYEQSACADLIEQLWCEPDRLIDSGEKLVQKRCVRTTVRLSAAEECYVVKRYLERSWRHRMKQFVLRSRAQRCWNDTWFLLENGYPTPMPVAYREDRFGPLRGRSYYVYKYIGGATLKELATGMKNQRILRKYVTQLVAIWRLHNRLCVNLSDGHPANFVVDSTGRMWVIDLDKLQYVNQPTKQLQQLEKSFLSTLEGVFGDRAIIEFGLRQLKDSLAEDSTTEQSRTARTRFRLPNTNTR